MPSPEHFREHLLFLPDATRPRLFLWGEGVEDGVLGASGQAERVRCLTPAGRFEAVSGVSLGLLDALPRLAAYTAPQLERSSPSVAVWSLAGKFALDLVARGRIVPRIMTRQARTEARCAVSLASAEDAERFARLASAFPLAAHALAVEAGDGAPTDGRTLGKAAARSESQTDPQAGTWRVWAPDALLERFLDAAADVIVRSAMRPVRPARRAAAGWERRFLGALSGVRAAFSAKGFGERSLLEDLRTWIRPVAGAERGEARVCLRLEVPDEQASATEPANGDSARFRLRFLLQSASDPSLMVTAADVYRGKPETLRRVARDHRSAQEQLLSGLATAARLFPPIQAGLRQATPEEVLLTPATAHTFLQEAAPLLMEAGFGVLLPAELTRAGRRRLRMRLRVGEDAARAAAPSTGTAALGLEDMLAFRWDAELAGEALTPQELAELARLKSPLVRHRGRWVVVESDEIAEALRLLEQGGGAMAAHEAVALALGDSERLAATSLPIEVDATGHLDSVLERLRTAQTTVAEPPAGFRGTLRPYQQRGLGWLSAMADLRLGACLADDMGLGKTIQLIALLLERRERLAPGEVMKPALLVCPTSVVGNWERELARFAPSLPVVRHYGANRPRAGEAFESLPDGAVVLTTYGLLRRDVQALATVPWSVAALDEAQNIKNPSSRTAHAARALVADFRVALTGTPVENRLAELWSIFEFLNPRLLGPLAKFRREYALPIERYGQVEVAERLRRIVRPFILRRLKSDRSIIRDLPEKQEMKVICSLTREQASLYQAALDETLRKIEGAEGIERRGLVLSLITALKQICNHPAQYLGEAGPLPGRSGKLQRCMEMLEEVVAAGDRALVFTQYREMGERLVAEIERVLGIRAPFLHGGVARGARDEMVRRFQHDARAAPIFVLSVKAGGTGLNLTAANHVFHFDRWWNPAVEDQATDRAFRIGQSRAVQVHKLLCAGTVEEKVDLLLEQKRELAASIVGAGEHWITELDDVQLRELFSLSPDAVIAAEGADGEGADADEVAIPLPRAAHREEERI